MDEVRGILKTDWQILERFVKELLAKEELDYDEIAAIFMEYGKPPKLLPPAPAPLLGMAEGSQAPVPPPLPPKI